MNSKPLSLWSYGLAILLVGLATLLTFFFSSFLERTVFILFFAAVMASSWYGGLGPGFLAIILAVLAAVFLFLPPIFTFTLDSFDEIIQVTLFVLVALLINWLTETRTRLNRDLNRQITELQTLLDILPVGVCVAHDPACLEMTVNPAGARLLNISVEDNASKSGPQGEQLPFKILQNGVEVSPHELPMQYAAEHDTFVHDVEYDILHPDGRSINLLEYASPLHDEQGQVRGSVGVFVDVTNLKRAEQAQRLLAEMAERNRLAQELHDTVAQTLGYLNLKISLTHSLLDSDGIETAKANLQELKQVVSETYTDVREEIFNLRTKVMLGLSFMEMLQRYIDKYHRFYNLDIHLIQEADPALFDFPPEVGPQLIRTIQEALINIRKHAQVKMATIRLGQERGQVRISIEDDGQGFDPDRIKEKTASFGLQIMRERVESVGGSLEIDTAPGHGTKIILRYG
jgi:signal transduction histidine kinase